MSEFLLKRTCDQSHLTAGFLVCTSHHRSHGVVHYGNHIQLKLLQNKQHKKEISLGPLHPTVHSYKLQ